MWTTEHPSHWETSVCCTASSERFPRNINKRKRPHCAYVHVYIFMLDLYLQNKRLPECTDRSICMHMSMCTSQNAHIHLGDEHAFLGQGWGTESDTCLRGPVPAVCLPEFSPLHFLSTLGCLDPASAFQYFRTHPTTHTTVALPISFPFMDL